MKILYLDLFSGMSGDMFIGAMIDLGLSPESLETELSRLGLKEYDLKFDRQSRSQVEGVKFDVILHETETAHHHHHHHGHHHHGPGPADQQPDHEPEHGRNFTQIRALLEQSELSDWVKQNSVETFARIARAEGKVHGVPPEEVHFHEVGAVDSIVDIVGAAVALELMDRPRVRASKVIEGSGWVKCAHGRFPVPTMATLAILGERGIAVSQTDETHELVTPTGAALLAQFAESFEPMQELVATKIGYGLGTRELQSRPNVLRAVLSELPESNPVSTQSSEPELEETDTIVIVECNLDDTTPELLGYVLDQTLEAGALDAFHSPIQMKKQRPGVLFSLLCRPRDIDRFVRLILTETSAFGVRTYRAERSKLQRTVESVATPYGPVPVKIGILDGKAIKAQPEYETCRQLARQHQVTVREVFDSAQFRYRQLQLEKTSTDRSPAASDAT